MPVEAADIRVVITSPAAATHDSSFSPMSCADPDEILFVAFCKTPEIRAELMERLRATAKLPQPAADRVDSLSKELEGAFQNHLLTGETAEAMEDAVRWWTQVRRKPYHAYSLKASIGPYQSSCLVAFAEPDALTIRFNLARALDVLERERNRVMDFFGWEGSTEGF